ncbi:MAG: THUMP-like domain-containing protein [Actinomycetota bacterium]
MEREDFIALLSPAGQSLLRDTSYDSTSDVVKMVSELRAQGHEPNLVAAVLTQAKLRRRAKAKFGDFADSMLFTEAGLEQASRLKVAALHAGRYKAAGIEEVADLGCGIGAEAMAMAAIGIKVKAYDIDEVTAAVATYNLSPFDNAEVFQEDVTKLDIENFEAVFLDPARREVSRGQSRREFDPNNYSPNFNFCLEVATKKPTGIKLGPGQDRKTIPENAEAQWVSVSGDLVEMSLWFKSLRREAISRSALLLDSSGAHEITSSERESENAPLGELQEYLYEPDNSLIRSRLISDFAKDFELNLIAPDIAYLSSAKVITSPWLSGYRIEDNLPFDRKKLKSYLRGRGIGILEIKKRGSDISPEQLRKEMALKGEGAATLIVTRVGDAHRVLVTQPISH